MPELHQAEEAIRKMLAAVQCVGMGYKLPVPPAAPGDEWMFRNLAECKASSVMMPVGTEYFEVAPFEEVEDLRMVLSLCLSELDRLRSGQAPAVCQCPACYTPHSSDCAVHNPPAGPAGPCDCGARPAQDADSRERALLQSVYGAATRYFSHFGVDEAESPDCCAGQQHHEDAVALRDALSAMAQARKVGGNGS